MGKKGNKFVFIVGRLFQRVGREIMRVGVVQHPSLKLEIGVRFSPL